MAAQTRVIRDSRHAAHDGHSHSAPNARAQLRLGFLLTLAILAVEVAGSLISHSLALFSDAAHVLTDAAALGLAWFAAIQAERPPNARRTFGHARIGIVTALVNGMTLVVIAGIIAFEAFRRFQEPTEVAPLPMIVAAAAGLLVNLYIARNLHRHEGENLNVRAAVLHVIGDIGASVGVIIGALAILVTGAWWVDPALSVVIAGLIAFSAVRLIGEALNILLESTPPGIAVDALARDMRRVPGIRNVHDLHVWTIAGGMRALSCHAIIRDIPPSESALILDRLDDMLRRTYRICHTTIQFESREHAGHEGCACQDGNKSDLFCRIERLHDEHGHAHAHSH